MVEGERSKLDPPTLGRRFWRLGSGGWILRSGGFIKRILKERPMDRILEEMNGFWRLRS